MTGRTAVGLDALSERVGTTLGTSRWRRIEQEVVDAFAAVTGDHQWIHVDPVRAANEGLPGTIVHGYLILSLIPVLGEEAFRVTDVGQVLNHRLDDVRFRTPVPVGAAVRASFTLSSTRPRPRGWVEVVLDVTVSGASGTSSATSGASGAEERVHCRATQTYLYAPA